MTLPLKSIIGKMNSIRPLPGNINLQLYNTPIRMEFSKYGVLSRRGETCDYLYYIEQGLLGCYELYKKKEIYNWLMLDGDIATSVDSFNHRVISTETIIAIEPSVIWGLHWNDLERISEESADFRAVRQALTDIYHIQSRKMDSQRKRGAAHFYEYLSQEYPELIARVPIAILISFMGITKPTFYSMLEKRRKSKK